MVVASVLAALHAVPLAGAEAYDHEVPDQCTSFAVSPAPGLGRSVTVCGSAGASSGPPETPAVTTRTCALPYGSGVTVRLGDGRITACLSYQAWGDPLQPPPLPAPLTVTPQNCPLGFAGLVLRVGPDGHVTVCVQYQIVVPSQVFPIRVDTSPCTAQAIDPAVFLGNGGVRVCLVAAAWPPTVKPEAPEMPSVDLSPCSEGFDPSVTWGRLGIAFCLEADADAPTGLPLGGVENPCDAGISVNATLVGQRARACLAVAP